MRRAWIAVRAFFAVLFGAEVAAEVERVLDRTALPGPPEARQVPKPQPPAGRPPVRSDALTLLSTLQRESRLVDFVKEPLAPYSDAQIGAVARDFHRDCGRVLERLFALKPIVQDAEGDQIEVPAGFDSGLYRLTGNVTGEPPFRGRLRHPGWEATICELPTFSGSQAAARAVAPVEVELEQGEATE